MEFVNEFTVPVGVDRAFEILTDLERVAPCLPGATLEEVDGDAYTGKVKVKVGPVTVIYRGTAEITELDADAKHAKIAATGKETRGTGTAAADVTADLEELDAERTKVTVTTDLKITGKPAQFGRGVMGEVGTKLIDTFAARLEEMIEQDEHGDGDPELPPSTPAPAAGDVVPGPDAGAAATTGAATSSGPRRIPPPAQEPDALDLMEVAGGAMRKRLIPVAVAAVVIALLVWWRRRDG